MTPEQLEIATRIRRRAFLSRRARPAIAMLRLADEIGSMRFEAPPLGMLLQLRCEDPPMPDLDPPPPPRRCDAWWDGESLICRRADRTVCPPRCPPRCPAPCPATGAQHERARP
jgi:hypothetical protein